MDRMYKYLILLPFLSIFAISPMEASAAVTLPWSTTFNCADWKQSDGLYSVNCDGLTGGGGWTCDNGDGTIREEQITAVANNPNGAGGKGQRHYFGDGINNESGGLMVSFVNPQSEFWVRWYIKYEYGFKWKTLVNQKVIYIDPVGNARLVVGFYSSDKIQVYSYASSKRYDSGPGYGWTSLMGGPASDGQWHYWELHVKKDTNGADGVVELWIDGRKVIYSNTADLGTTQFHSIMIGDNGFEAQNGRCMAIDYDDIAISNTGYIGPLPDNLHPSPPTLNLN